MNDHMSVWKLIVSESKSTVSTFTSYRYASVIMFMEFSHIIGQKKQHTDCCALRLSP